MVRFRKTLIVDDDPASRFLLQIVLIELGLSTPVVTLVNGKEALDYIQQQCINENAAPQNCPDWILLDLNMPVMGGLELLDCLKALRQEDLIAAAVTVITSSSYTKDIERVKQLGVKGYLLKPVTEDKMREYLSTHFQ